LKNTFSIKEIKKSSSKNSPSIFAKLLAEKKLICICGKMASGKNYVCSLLEKLGWSCVDADLLVHEAINQSTEKILAEFSDEAAKNKIIITNSDGTINRKALGQLLFKNPALLKKQEDIVYPVIIKMIEDFISRHEKTVINATVLYKTPDLLARCEKIIFVTAPYFTRLRRARRRDHLPLRQIVRRFHAQRHLLKEYQKTGIPVEIIQNK
jgi:dephospho-CoA kinase